MIDIGVNLFSSQFDGEHEELLADAYQAGVNAVLITGTTVANSRQAQTFCRQRTAGSYVHEGRSRKQKAKSFSDGWYHLGIRTFFRRATGGLL